MTKVHITLKNKKGDTLISAVGLIDLETKDMLVPKVSKKGTPYIDIIKCEDVRKTEYGYIVINVDVSNDDRVYVNTYYLTDLTKTKESK